MNNINSILVTFHKYLLKAAVRPRLVGHLCLYCTSKLNLSQPGLAMQQCLNLQSMVHSHVSTPSCNLPQNSTFRNRNFPSFIFTKFLNPKVRCGSIQERLREKKNFLHCSRHGPCHVERLPASSYGAGHSPCPRPHHACSGSATQSYSPRR